MARLPLGLDLTAARRPEVAQGTAAEMVPIK